MAVSALTTIAPTSAIALKYGSAGASQLNAAAPQLAAVPKIGLIITTPRELTPNRPCQPEPVKIGSSPRPSFPTPR